MKILKKEMSRRDFLKFILGGAALLGLASVIPKIPKFKKSENKKENYENYYGNGVYGGKG